MACNSASSFAGAAWTHWLPATLTWSRTSGGCRRSAGQALHGLLALLRGSLVLPDLRLEGQRSTGTRCDDNGCEPAGSASDLPTRRLRQTSPSRGAPAPSRAPIGLASSETAVFGAGSSGVCDFEVDAHEHLRPAA